MWIQCFTISKGGVDSVLADKDAGKGAMDSVLADQDAKKVVWI